MYFFYLFSSSPAPVTQTVLSWSSKFSFLLLLQKRHVYIINALSRHVLCMYFIKWLLSKLYRIISGVGEFTFWKNQSDFVYLISIQHFSSIWNVFRRFKITSVIICKIKIQHHNENLSIESTWREVRQFFKPDFVLCGVSWRVHTINIFFTLA